MRKTNKGITLIALIITIVVMLILVGVVVSTTINSNLINKVKTATGDYKEAEGNDANLLGVEVDGIRYNSLQDYVEGKLPPADRSELSIGDYVNYTPAGTVYVTKYKDPDGVETVQRKYSGYTANQDVYLQDTKWRILDIKDNGEIELISEKEVYIGNTKGNTKTLYFQGATGYNNGVELLNDICYKLYGTGEYVKGVRNLKIEDIQDTMNKKVWDWKDYQNENVDTKKYEGTNTYTGGAAYYPARWAEEVTGKVNGILTGGKLGKSDSGTNLIAWDTEKNTEKKGLTYFPDDTQNASITMTQTLWENSSWTGDNFINSKFLNLLIKHEDGTNFKNWLASRYAYAHTGHAVFGLGRVSEDKVHGCSMMRSDCANYGNSMGLRPVVTLERTVKLTKDKVNSKEGEVTYWNLAESK